MTEEQYNQKLLRICKEEGITVIGFANHGSVDGVDAIRQIMNQNDIVVFPGFEISSSEKAYMLNRISITRLLRANLPISACKYH
ncbi:MAG: hypothetical protein WBN94_11070 [Methanothrix sp.]